MNLFHALVIDKKQRKIKRESKVKTQRFGLRGRWKEGQTNYVKWLGFILDRSRSELGIRVRV